MSGKRKEEGVGIVIQKASGGKPVPAADRAKIERLVRERILAKDAEPVMKVQVEVKRGPGGRPRAVVATLLRARTFTADLVSIEVDEDFEPKPGQ